jgi:hypothetical protein
MENNAPTKWTKLKWSMPWMTNYPFWRVREWFSRPREMTKQHLIFIIANHFEPAWGVSGNAGLKLQIKRVNAWSEKAKGIAESLKDSEGRSYRHTYFYPIEQYHSELLEILSEMQADDLGEVEIHLHHGVEKPDTAENLKRVLTDVRDTLAEKHKILSRMENVNHPVYAFVHGNSALANSAGGFYCGVNEEMQILAETGCYVDMTLPTAPDRTQVKMLNTIYECEHPFDKPVPHRSGNHLKVGKTQIKFPFIFTGPLVLNWTERSRGLVAPRLDDGVLAANQPLDIARFERWRKARIGIEGKEDWIFIKLYCHGFIEQDQDSMIGERALRFFSEVIEHGERSGKYQVHFATAREAANMVFAAVDGKDGSPGEYSNYLVKSIMQSVNKTVAKASFLFAFGNILNVLI